MAIIHLFIRMNDCVKCFHCNPTSTFVQNWCAVVIDTTLDRITRYLAMITLTVRNMFDPFWDGQKLSQLSRHVHRETV